MYVFVKLTGSIYELNFIVSRDSFINGYYIDGKQVATLCLSVSYKWLLLVFTFCIKGTLFVTLLLNNDQP